MSWLERPFGNYIKIGQLGLCWYRRKDWKDWKKYAKGRWWIVHHYTNGRTGFQIKFGEVLWG